MQSILVYIFLLLLRSISLIGSRKATIKLGQILGSIMMNLSTKRKNITFKNLKQAFPERSDKEIKDLTIKCYENLGISFVEILSLDKLTESQIRSIITFDNIELLNEKFAEANGLILMSGHFGNWEYLAYAAGLFSQIPINIVVKPQKNQLVDKKINEIRVSANNKVFPSNNAGKELIRILSSKQAVALLTDQNASKDKGLYLKFFGREVPSYDVPARLALKYKAPIIIGFAVRDENYNYKVILEEIKYDDLENDEMGIKVLTERFLNRLEEEIRKHPQLWAWQHRRWKHAK